MKKLSVCAFSFLLFLAVCIIFSCSGLSGSFNQDVHEYFDMMTNTAAIEKHDIPVATQTGSGGRLCISSADGPVTVSYYLRNPKLFKFTEGLNLIHSFVDSEAETASTGANEVTVKQSQSDLSVIDVKYPLGFLREMEGGEHSIAESINIKHPYSLEDFGTYSISLYCNSAPPLMQGGVCLADDSSPSKAVLFMNLPNKDSLRYIHKDLKYLKVDGRRFEISVDDSGVVSFASGTTNPVKIASAVSSNPTTGSIVYGSHTYSRFGSSNAVYSYIDSNTSLFYETGDNLSLGKSYTVELVDNLGFSSSIIIDASANQIGEVTYQNQNGDTVKYTDSQGAVTTGVETIYGDEGKAYLVLVPPADAPDAVLSYRIYESSGGAIGNFVVSGKVNGKKSIAVPCPEVAGDEAGHYIIKAYAHKNLYADSAESTCTIETKPSTYFGSGGLVSVDDIMVWVDGNKATDYSSSSIAATRGSISLPLVATPASATASDQGAITEDLTWRWQLLLDGEPALATPSISTSNTVSFNATNCNPEYTYSLWIEATYCGRKKVFYCKIQFS